MLSKLPLISLIIPTFNEERYISDCLSAVANLNYPKELLEVIVVDNGSKDRTVEIAENFNCTVLTLPAGRVGAVRNFGVSNSGGEIIAFLDGDCVPPKNWLLSAIEQLDRFKCDAVGGVYLLKENPSWIERAWVLTNDLRDRSTSSLVGGSIIIKRRVFDQLLGFDENLNAGEDSDLARRLIAANHKVRLAGDCAVIHMGYPDTLSVFIRRQFWHASSYLKSRNKNGLDVVFIFSIIFLSCFIFLPISVIFFPFLILLPFTLIFLLPLALSIKRILSSGYRSSDIGNYVKIYILDFCYLVGRAGGLTKSILTELKVISDKKVHY